MRSAAGQTTTITSAQSGQAPPSAEDLAVQWVAPKPMLTVVRVLQDAPLILGRRPDCAIPLPGTEVSRSHAEILREGSLLTIRNLSSRNGVFVRGAKVEEAPLQVGDVIRLGEWVGVIVMPPAQGPERSAFAAIVPGLYGGRRLRETLAPVERAARSDLPVTICGETGTGKEWTARAIHQWSGRTGPFLAVNCAALPVSLAEAELFGYRKGAFTGADRASPGYFRAAHGGTLLLDEIVDLPMGLQAKLLRVLEQREVVPLGEPTPVPVDVRIVAAAQQSLAEAVKEGKCRADLYARLDGLAVRLPPLRERIEDVPGLFQVKLGEHAGRTPALDWRFVERLCLHDWPFNVREIDLLARRLAVLHADEPVLRVAHLPERFHARPRHPEAPRPVAKAAGRATNEKPENRDEHDMTRLLAALRKHHGNVARASNDAEISRQRAYRLMGARPDVNWREPEDNPKQPAPSVMGPGSKPRG
jgi:transcriptional regulator with AAA-type ATPase domain